MERNQGCTSEQMSRETQRSFSSTTPNPRQHIPHRSAKPDESNWNLEVTGTEISMTKRRSGGVRAEVGTNQGNEWVGVGEQYTSKWNSARVNLRQKIGWIGAFLRWKLIIAPISRAPLHGCSGALLPKLSKRF